MISRRALRAMKARWERDLAKLEADQPVGDRWEWSTPNIETQRNLATAIAQINGMITGLRDDEHGRARAQTLQAIEEPTNGVR